ncbi:translocation/assembly module TamB domain-containing protein [Algoriphagus taiwanensis]|uniref:Translocation/assembly module TamB domain-containing protein n=1 Tax=Algoriphagus taiwanensis TaxID=1445656 RepID=A0ABQ6PZP1_9BACT|nr:translocation/assembly module TamB domain-containing protein [Algoriphagus taiwanensis]
MHKAFRLLSWVIFSTLLLFIFLALALQVTSVQNWAIDRVTSFLNSDSEFTTEIGKIKLNWWDALDLEEVKIYDSRDSLMIGVDRAHADFALLSLLPPGDIEVDLIRLEKAKIHLFTHSGDSIININQWVNELSERFGSSKPSSKPISLKFKTIELRQSEFFLVDFNSEPIEQGLDYARLQFDEITANAENFTLNGSTIGIDIKTLTGKEINSGLNIRELKTQLTYDPAFLELDRLSLKTDKSNIQDFLRLDLIGPEGFSDFLNQVKITAKMNETKVHLSDLRLFVPDFPEIEDAIFLSGTVLGPVSEIKSDEFLLRLGEKTAIFGSFLLDGLPDFEKTYLNLSLKNSVISSRDLAPYLPTDIEKQINKFNLIRFDTDFQGVPTRFVTNGSFKTSIGNLEGRITYDMVNNLPYIVSRVKVQNLDLGILAENRELLQKVSLEGNVDLKGNSIENLLVDMKASISQLGVNSYNFTGIRTDATYGLNLFRGNLDIDDPNLMAQIDGYLNLEEGVDSIRLVANLDTLNLDQINLSEKPAFIAGKMDINTKGVTLDEITGIAKFNDMKFGYEDRLLDFGGAYFQSLFAGGTRTISFNSDYMVAAASGQFNLGQMLQDLEILGQQYLAIVLNEPQPTADLEKNFSEPYNLDLNVRMPDINPIIQLFQPDFSISKNTILEGAFYQTSENTVFNFFTSIDTLSYQDKTALGTNIDFNTSKIINSEDILASFYIYSKEQKIGEQLAFNNLGFEAIWNQTNLDLEFSLDQDSTQSKARIEAETKFSSSGTEIRFKPSLLRVLNRDWEFDPTNRVAIAQGEITFENLKIFKDEQLLGVEGKISSDPEETLRIDIQSVSLDLLNTVTPYEFEGTTTGQLLLSNLQNQANFRGKISIADTEINQFPIGNLEASASLSESELILDLVNDINGVEKITANGTIGLDSKNLDLEARLDEANLVIFEPFLSQYITNLGGNMTGNLQLRGTMDLPELIGTGRLNQAKFRVNYLNTSYQMDGSVLFQPTLISFRDLVLRDINGSRATFTGGIRHNGFSDFNLDITSRLNNFQVLNTTARESEMFYGTAFATGSLEVKGSTSNLNINASVTSQPNTRVFIPLVSSNDQYQEDFIQIINIQDTVRINALAEDVNRLDIQNVRMNFNLDVTPDAYVEIIIDPKTGESIQGRGRGVLAMNVDTQGNFGLSGNYEITEGLYNFSLYNVVKKQFIIQPGGRITWFGDPLEGIMNLRAVYEENVNLQPLASTTSLQENSQMRRRFPLKVLMDLEGELLSPDIRFSFDFSEFPSSGDVQTTISAFQNRVAADEQEMNRQVVSVIISRSFSPEGEFTGVATISSSLSSLVSSQLNNLIGSLDKNLEINIDLATLDQNALENFQLSVAYTFLDGRLRVSRDGGFTDNQGNANAASIIGDWQAEYLITEDGVYRLRIFNRNNFNTFTSLSLTQNVLTYGASLTQNVSFNSFSELFNIIFKKKNRNNLTNDSDDFLRRDYQPDEDWKPIDLEKLPPFSSPTKSDSIRVIIPSKENL